MLCAICGREGRGFCWLSPRRSDIQRTFKRFCSMACQEIHQQRFKGGHVIDPTHNENAAVVAVLPVLGDYVAKIGMDKPLADYSREQILQLIETVLDGYFAHLRANMPDDVPF